jgi:virginiamycin B lyase
MSGGTFSLTNAAATPKVTITEFPGSAYAPIGIAAGSDGALWSTSESDVIYKTTTGGVTTPYSNDIISGSSVIAAGPDGNLWFIDFRGAIGRITSAGVVTEFTKNLSPGGQPDNDGITAGPDGNVWFTENSSVTNGVGVESDAIGRITPSGIITEFTAGITPNAVLGAIATGPDGDLWFTEILPGGGGGIGKINPKSGAVTEYQSPLLGRFLGGIVAGSDGNIWFIDESNNAIGKITTTGLVTEFSSGISPGAGLVGIAAGPDGNLWFTENTGNRIGRITTAGVVTEFSSNIAPNSGLGGITAGPDDTLWFTATGIGGVGEVSGIDGVQ